MKVNELRLNNYVKLMLNDEDYEILVITIKDLDHIEKKEGIYEPIRFTEELLENLGFERCGYSLLSWKHPKLPNVEFSGINWADRDIPEYQFLNFRVDDEVFSIHFVHQLQNLFFLLTKEELTFKSE